MKMVRSSGAFSTWAFGLESTWRCPDRHRLDDVDLAREQRTRVVSEAIGVKMIFPQVTFHLAPVIRAGLNTVFTPG